jgi:hypothetical protein
MVHRKVRSGPPAPVAPLTDATGPYVGEPREPAEPYRAPGWLRYAPSWLQQGVPGMDLGLGVDLPPSPPPLPEPPRPAPRPVLPPSRIIEAPDVVDEVAESTSDTPAAAPLVLPVEPGRPRRRPNLGQSRRLGLGAPLTHAPQLEPVEEPAPEPPPVVPQPVQVTPAPTPVAAPPVAESARDGSDDEEPPPPPPPAREPPALVHRPAESGRRDDSAAFEAPEPPVAATVPPAVQSIPAPVPVVPQAPQVPLTPGPVSLVYRSAPGRRDQQAKPANTVRRATTITPPAGVAAAITSRHGVDVSNVLVHRGPDVSTAARSLGARAFTRGGEVYLPDDAGSLDTPKARGLLAHELVHAVQQRTLGSALPALSTPASAALEAEAVAAEHEHSGQGTHTHAASQPLVHPALTQVITQAARTVGVQLAPLETSSSFSFASEPASAPAQPSTSDTRLPLSEPVRQEMDLIAEANAIRVFEQWTNPDLGGAGFDANPVGGQAFPGATVESFPPSAPAELPAVQNSAAEQEMANQILHVINLDRASKGEPTLSALDEATLEQVRRTIAEQNVAATTRMAIFGASSAVGAEAAYRTEMENSGPAGRVADIRQPSESGDTAMTFDAGTPAPAEFATAAGHDSALRDGQVDIERIDLEELSTRLYDKIRSRLRLELLVDRERSGLLSDFR